LFTQQSLSRLYKIVSFDDMTADYKIFSLSRRIFILLYSYRIISLYLTAMV